MYYIYMIKSLKSQRLYYGYTCDLKRRLEQHNQGVNRSTKSHKPWELIYYEAYKCRKDALNREKQMKRYSQALGHLKNRLAYSLQERK